MSFELFEWLMLGMRKASYLYARAYSKHWGQRFSLEGEGSGLEWRILEVSRIVGLDK